jgi:hypothetical protein
VSGGGGGDGGGDGGGGVIYKLDKSQQNLYLT